MIIWIATLVCNLIFAFVLLYREHYSRYQILFSALVFEIFAAPLLYFTYQTYGTSSGIYYFLYHAKKMITILFSFGIVFEGWRWKNKCLSRPQEAYLLALLIAFLAEKIQFLSVSDTIHDFLRYGNIALTMWWTWCFRAEFTKEKRYFRYN